MFIQRTLAGISLAAALAAGTLRAAPLADDSALPPPAMTILPSQVQTDQQRFLAEIYQFCGLERQMGELALTRSSRIPIQEYARHMVDVQARRQRDLELLARDVQVSLPKPSRADQETLDRLGAWQGDAFNRAYLNATIASHEAASAVLQNQALGPRASSIGTPLPPIVHWAQRNVPIVNEELGRAQTIAQSLGIARAPEPSGL